jgi:L-ascorbate metabolism protein UlaG (beta-lactamase superfamily)
MLVMVLATLLAGVASAAPPAVELRFTFIGNMAFHITDGRVAVLIDFPYQSGAFGYMDWSKAMLPKGPAPLCVISHSHDDHFAPRLAQEYCGTLLGPKDVVAGSRVKALELKDDVRWEGLVIRPVATKHADVEHYSYLIEWAGAKLFFSGDTADPAALLAARGLDLAFVSPWLLAAVESNGQKIDAARVVVYHHRASEAVPEIQGRLLPRQGDVLVLSGKTPVRVVERGPEPIPPAELDAFEKLLREANANVQTPAGKTYFEGFFAQLFSRFGTGISECMQETGLTEAPSFDMVLALGEDGAVTEASLRPEMPFTTCVLALAKKDPFPPPPAAGFRVPVAIRFKK